MTLLEFGKQFFFFLFRMEKHNHNQQKNEEHKDLLKMNPEAGHVPKLQQSSPISVSLGKKEKSSLKFSISYQFYIPIRRKDADKSRNFTINS